MIRGVPWARIGFVVGAVATLALVAEALDGRALPGWLVAVIALTLLASLAGGIFVQGAGLFARPLLAVDETRAQGRLALTFDDGPHADETRRVAALLESRGHRGTFFPIGRKIEAQLELLRELVQRGHALGNHSFSHAHALPFYSVEKLADDLERAQSLLERAGARRRWFRPPVGILSPRVVGAARACKLELVGWSGTARDGVAATVEQSLERLRRKLRPGAILVLHDGSERDDRAPVAAAVLERLLDEMGQRGLRSVTLDELLGGGG